jgi:hypothetical protein
MYDPLVERGGHVHHLLPPCSFKRRKKKEQAYRRRVVEVERHQRSGLRLKDNAQQAEEDIICDRLDTLLLRQHSRSCSSNCDDEAVVNEAMILCKLYLLAQRNNDITQSLSFMHKFLIQHQLRQMKLSLGTKPYSPYWLTQN